LCAEHHIRFVLGHPLYESHPRRQNKK
jgi:hypothetical protein